MPNSNAACIHQFSLPRSVTVHHLRHGVSFAYLTLSTIYRMHKSTISNPPSSFRFFSNAGTPVTTPDDSHNQQTSYFSRSASSSKKPSRPPLQHHKSLDNVMFGRGGGRDYVNANNVPSNGAGMPQSPNALYETVFEVATKRMATLDYLRRAYVSQGHLHK